MTIGDQEYIMESLEGLSPRERIGHLLEAVREDTPRHRTLSEALDFKGSWVRMAHRLRTVEEGELWSDWGYKSLKEYAREELQLSRGELRKLRDGYAWLEEEAPDLATEAEAMETAATPQRRIPDMETVDQLAKGYREVQKEKVPRDRYESLKAAALQGERSHYQLRREFKEAVPEHKRERPAPDPRRHFKRALKAFEKALAELEEMQEEGGDPALATRVRKLRDEMSQLVEEGEQSDG